MYERSKGKASPASYKRAKEMMKDPKWLLAGSDSGTHPILLRGADANEKRKVEEAKKNLLRSVNAFRPGETVFEVGSKANSENLTLMKERRKALNKSAQKALASSSMLDPKTDDDDDCTFVGGEVEMADEEALTVRYISLQSEV
jgi:ATP-dependent RNA helicase DDX54/DBP10